MIFSGDLCDKVLAGTKTQTRRPVKLARFPGDSSCQYKVGQSYAIQRKRGTHGLGTRIRVLSVQRVPTFPISAEDAKAEGFDSPTAFETRWLGFYGDKHPVCWRIEFDLVQA